MQLSVVCRFRSLSEVECVRACGACVRACRACVRACVNAGVCVCVPCRASEGAEDGEAREQGSRKGEKEGRGTGREGETESRREAEKGRERSRAPAGMSEVRRRSSSPDWERQSALQAPRQLE